MPLKLVNHFTYLGNNISSTESDVNKCIGKAWTAIDRLLIIWKSNLSDKIKQEFFKVVTISVWLYHLDKQFKKKLDGNYIHMLMSF